MTKIDEQQSTIGAQRYYMHAQAHDAAAQKYSISAKSIDPTQAKTHRKMSKLHKQIAASLQQIAGLHTSTEYNQIMQKRNERMTQKQSVKEETVDQDLENQDMDSVEDNTEITEAYDILIGSLFNEQPGEFLSSFTDLIRERALDKIEDMKIGLAVLTFNEAVDATSDTSDDEDAPDEADAEDAEAAGQSEPANEEVEQVDEKHIGFKKLEGELSHEKGVTNPGGLAAAIGRKKYGKKKFDAMSHKG